MMRDTLQIMFVNPATKGKETWHVFKLETGAAHLFVQVLRCCLLKLNKNRFPINFITSRIWHDSCWQKNKTCVVSLSTVSVILGKQGNVAVYKSLLYHFAVRTCDSITQIENGYVVGPTASYACGTALTYKCDVGYEMMGTRDLVCANKGHFTPKLPRYVQPGMFFSQTLPVSGQCTLKIMALVQGKHNIHFQAFVRNLCSHTHQEQEVLVPMLLDTEWQSLVIHATQGVERWSVYQEDSGATFHSVSVSEHNCILFFLIKIYNFLCKYPEMC